MSTCIKVLHARYKFLYTSLPGDVKQQRKIREMKPKRPLKFYLKLNAVLHFSCIMLRVNTTKIDVAFKNAETKLPSYGGLASKARTYTTHRWL